MLLHAVSQFMQIEWQDNRIGLKMRSIIGSHRGFYRFWESFSDSSCNPELILESSQQ